MIEGDDATRVELWGIVDAGTYVDTRDTPATKTTWQPSVGFEWQWWDLISFPYFLINTPAGCIVPSTSWLIKKLFGKL